MTTGRRIGEALARRPGGQAGAGDSSGDADVLAADISLVVKPMQSPTRGFPESEFETRTAVMQEIMHDRKVDAVLLTTEPNVRYFSGFLTQFWQSPTRPWFPDSSRTGKAGRRDS